MYFSSVAILSTYGVAILSTYGTRPFFYVLFLKNKTCKNYSNWTLCRPNRKNIFLFLFWKYNCCDLVHWREVHVNVCTHLPADRDLYFFFCTFGERKLQFCIILGAISANIQNNLQNILKNHHFLQQKLQKNITSLQKLRAARARLHKSTHSELFEKPYKKRWRRLLNPIILSSTSLKNAVAKLDEEIHFSPITQITVKWLHLSKINFHHII